MSYAGGFSFSDTVDGDNDPDYVYYNATIINNDSRAFDYGPDPAIRFQETRDVPIIKDASKYNFSIVRFTMNGANKDLPLFIPVIRTGAANPLNDVNLTIYSLTIKIVVDYTVAGTHYVNTFESTQPLRWITETDDLRLAPIPLAETCQTGQDISTRYYWCYTYSHWMRIFSNASIDAIAQIQTDFDTWWVSQGTPGGTVPKLQTVAPQFSWNPAAGLFTLYCDAYSFGDALCLSAYQQSLNPGIADRLETSTLYFNNNLFGMYSNFDNVYRNDGEKTNEIIVPNVIGQNLTTLTDPITGATKSYWIVQQDYESTSTLWSPIESIVFTSALLPLVFEQIGDPIRFGSGNDNASNSGRPAFSPIITDVALTNENANAYRTFILYSPTAEYRLASFQRSKQSINSIDIQCYWKNRLDGQLYPIQMFNGTSVSLKVMFRRRGVNSYPHPASKGVEL
jgi:hypothetical protein